MIRNFALAAPLFLLSGCWLTGLYLWAPYQPPGPGDFRTASAQPGCPRVGVQNLDRDETQAILAAVATACRIYHSPAFARQITSRRWRATCRIVRGEPDWISGEETLRLLTGPIGDFSVMARTPIAAIGQIDPPRARIAIRTWSFDQWALGGEHRQWLIWTTAHEMSHFVRATTEGQFRFQDGAHTGTRSGCPDLDLVSYGVGQIVKEIWLAEQQAGPSA